MAVLDDIGTFLTNQGVVSTGWTLYLGWLPSTPDLTISVFEAGGYGTPDDHAIENLQQTIQVRIRGQKLGYEVARTKWQSMFDALHGAAPGTCIYAMALQDGPTVWYDESERPNMTAYFKLLMPRS